MDLESLFEFSRKENKSEEFKEEKKDIIIPTIIEEEDEDIIPDTEFKHEKELYEGKEILDIKYGKNDEKNTYTIEPESILDPKHKLNLTETILVKNQENKYERKKITYTCINHYIFTKLLCEKIQQNKIITLKTYEQIKTYFEQTFNKCRIEYENKSKEEYQEISSSITQKQIPIRIYDKKIIKGKEKWIEKEIRIDISLFNYVIDKYTYILEYILTRLLFKYQGEDNSYYNTNFKQALLETGNYDIIYHNPDSLYYTKTNRGFMFEFNRRIDTKNIYGQVLQKLREKIKLEQSLDKDKEFQLEEFNRYYKKSQIKEFFKYKLDIVISDLKYFFEYLINVGFPATEVNYQSAYTMWENENIKKLKDELKGLDEKERNEKLKSIWDNLSTSAKEKYKKKENTYFATKFLYTDTLKDVQKELELRQNEKYGFFLTPDMVNYVIKEIMLSKISLSQPDIIYGPIYNGILNKLDNEFKVLKNEKEEKHNSSKKIIADIIWTFLYNSFDNIKGDNIKETITNIENEKQKLLEKKCNKSKEFEKVGCVIDAITYILITIMDWNEFIEITDKEIKTSILILGGRYFKGKLSELNKTKNNPVNDEIRNLLNNQIDQYELTITDELLNRLTNMIEFISKIDDDTIWENIMLYAHKF